MKKLLIAGLIISIISVLFNVFVYTYYSNHISEKENKISFLKSRNLMLSIEYANAEHTSFFSDYYAIEKMSLLNLPKSEIDKDYLRALNIRRDMSLAESLNGVINSTIMDPFTDYDSLKIHHINLYNNIFNNRVRSENYSGYTIAESKDILNLYDSYYQEHVNLIKTNNKQIKTLNDETTILKKYFGYSKGVAISLQVIGLILIFLKDTKKSKVPISPARSD